MKNPFDHSEIDAAVDNLRKAVDRLIDLGFHWEPMGALKAMAAIEQIRYLVTDAILEAFPRVDCPFIRSRLIGMIGAISPPEYDEALALLRRLVVEDPDEYVRLHADDILAWMKERDALEVA